MPIFALFQCFFQKLCKAVFEINFYLLYKILWLVRFCDWKWEECFLFKLWYAWWKEQHLKLGVRVKSNVKTHDIWHRLSKKIVKLGVVLWFANYNWCSCEYAFAWLIASNVVRQIKDLLGNCVVACSVVELNGLPL